MRKHTLVIEGGDIGGAFAIALALKAGLTDPTYKHRRDGRIQVEAVAAETDKAARRRWAGECVDAGLTVSPAPWETSKGAPVKAVAK